VIALEVFQREQRNDVRAAGERIMHLADEVVVREVPLLEDDAITYILENAADPIGERRIRPGSAEKQRLWDFTWS
jgi:hypothetical protein